MLQLDCSDLILNHAWINNQKTGSSDGRTFTVEDPADGTILAILPDCGEVEAEAAATAAHKAFSTWRALLLSGGRKALTVLEIASTPVSDEPPLAKARSTISRVAPMIRPLPCCTGTAPSVCAGS